MSIYRRNASKIARPHRPTFLACPNVHVPFQAEKHIVCFAVEVETNWGRGETAGADDGESVGGLLACHEQAHGGLGAWDIDSLAEKRRDDKRSIWGAWWRVARGQGSTAVDCHGVEVFGLWSTEIKSDEVLGASRAYSGVLHYSYSYDVGEYVSRPPHVSRLALGHQ
jgi:hypothetical protein